MRWERFFCKTVVTEHKKKSKMKKSYARMNFVWGRVLSHMMYWKTREDLCMVFTQYLYVPGHEWDVRGARSISRSCQLSARLLLNRCVQSAEFSSNFQHEMAVLDYPSTLWKSKRRVSMEKAFTMWVAYPSSVWFGLLLLPMYYHGKVFNFFKVGKLFRKLKNVHVDPHLQVGWLRDKQN